MLKWLTGGRGGDDFDQGVTGILQANGITNCRSVGGRFALDDEGRASLSRIGMRGDFGEAVVLVSDQPDDQSVALMAGRTVNGEFVVISVGNLARPGDIGKLTDKFSARRQANFVRNTLISAGTRTGPERTYV